MVLLSEPPITKSGANICDATCSLAKLDALVVIYDYLPPLTGATRQRQNGKVTANLKEIKLMTMRS